MRLGCRGKLGRSRKRTSSTEGFGEGKGNMRMQAIPRHVEERTPTQGLKKRTKSTWRGKGHRKKENRDVTPLNIYYIY